jgi:hypothetical protein|eukprot:COSAG06_NODE_2213_length_7329_cov_10.371784_2_plen_80_part_00
MMQVAGMMILMRDVLTSHSERMPEWATDACEIIETMLTPLIERVTTFGLCVLMLDVREKHPTVHDENYLDGMDEITGAS